MNSVIYRDVASVKMYAFYSLLVYIFYTVFKKEEEDALEAVCGASSDVCLVTYYPAYGGVGVVSPVGNTSCAINMHMLHHGSTGRLRFLVHILSLMVW